MTYGIKVSKTGKDVKTCGDEDLVYSSQYATLKVKAIGTLNDGQTYAHGLSYVPIVFSIVKFSSSNSGLVGQIVTGGSSVDATNVTADSDIKYYVFYEQAI
jgi:hypothetical protein